MITGVNNSANNGISNSRQIKGLNGMKAEDFLSIMVKELQQQDPFEPTSSKDLINQIGQVSNIQSSMELIQTLKELSLNQKLSAASTLLGKMILGRSEDGDEVNGLVTAVKREGDNIYIELDSGQRLSIDNVLQVFSKDESESQMSSDS